MTYSLDGEHLDLLGEPGQHVLADIRRDPSRWPGCLCNPSEDGGVPMYVARIGDRYYLKCMPGSGPDHAPDCGSWSPPAELSGLAPLLGTAIRDNPDTDPPTPCYVTDNHQKQISDTSGRQWIWNTSTDACMPALPPPSSGIPSPTTIRSTASSGYRDTSRNTADQ
ncbi:DUF1173 family protein [Nocardia macrotermitis]|uniref:Uncharacterized protein n=1 Tax=Nocardia macrotermitis TaxID=2585198 RepID=A0A7K0CZW8_9NOCA|nr:DUF1173 family protein [Nocardia macrotermitis]MQY18961.1 hypothetical protein [Nocardia macrotermitis]